MSEVRARILETAYELFSRRGVRDVGINEVIERAHVTKATLYHHFALKDDLVVAFLDLREKRWMRGWVQTEARRRADTPEQELLAIFDLYDEWFHR
jgi:AcrR family transcriptional regulator